MNDSDCPIVSMLFDIVFSVRNGNLSTTVMLAVREKERFSAYAVSSDLLHSAQRDILKIVTFLNATYPDSL